MVEEPVPASPPFRLMEHLAATRKKLDEESPILATRYFITFSWDERDDYNGGWDRKTQRIGKTFDTSEEAQTYKKELIANGHNKQYIFAVGGENLREHVSRWKAWGV